MNHDQKNLRSIWKGVNADYKSALTRFTTSGTHSNDFWECCNSKLEVYYLRKWLELKPDLMGMVEADLPEETFLSSYMDKGVKIHLSFNSSISEKKSRGKYSSIAEEIWEFTHSKSKKELENQKLEFLKKENERKEHASILEEWMKLNDIMIKLKAMKKL